MNSVSTHTAATSVSRTLPKSSLHAEESDALGISTPYLLTSTLSLGLATTGALLSSPLALASLGITAFAALPVLKESYQSLTNSYASNKLNSNAQCKQVPDISSHFASAINPSITIANSLLLTACVVTGSSVAAALGVTIYHLGKRLLQQSESNYRQQQIDAIANQEQLTWRKAELNQPETLLTKLRAGDVIRLDAGESTPLEGIVVDGKALIESLPAADQCTQNMPFEALPGAALQRNSKIVQGTLHLRLNHHGDAVAQQELQTLLEQADSVQQTAEREGEAITKSTLLPLLAATALSFPVVGLAGAAVVLNTHWGDTLRRLVPMTHLRFVQQVSSQGIQLQDAQALNKLGNVDTILFDPAVLQPTVGLREVYTCDGNHEQEVLHYAAALGYDKDNRLATALAPADPLALPFPDHFQQQTGGRSGWINDRLIHVGNAQMMRQAGIILPADLEETLCYCRESRERLLLVAASKRLIGAVALQPIIDPALPALLQQLEQQRMALYQMEDNTTFDTTFLPAEFASQIKRVPNTQLSRWLAQQQQAGKRVAVIAAGASTSTMLQASDVVIATHAAQAQVKAAAHLLLPAGGLAPLSSLFALSQHHKRRQRIQWGVTLGASALMVAGAFLGTIGLADALLVNGIILCSEGGPMLRPIFQAEWQGAWGKLQGARGKGQGAGCNLATLQPATLHPATF